MKKIGTDYCALPKETQRSISVIKQIFQTLAGTSRLPVSLPCIIGKQTDSTHTHKKKSFQINFYTFSKGNQLNYFMVFSLDSGNAQEGPLFEEACASSTAVKRGLGGNGVWARWESGGCCCCCYGS